MKDDINTIKSSKIFRAAREYWLEKLSGELEDISIPRDFPNTEQFQQGSFEATISGELFQRLLATSKGNDLALYVILLAGLKTLLYKYTGHRDITVAAPVYDGQNADAVSVFNEFIVLRDTISGEMSFRELLRALKVTVNDAFMNQHYPMKDIFGALNMDRGITLKRVSLLLGSIHKKQYSAENSEITLRVAKGADCLKMKIDYNAKLFAPHTIEIFFKCYGYILEQALSDMDRNLGDIETVGAEERNKLLYTFNATKTVYPDEKSVGLIFQEQAKLAPDKGALVSGGREYTYRELDERSNKVANLLREKGVGRDSIVGILCDRTADTIIGILGIIKAGGAYLPIDEDYPEARVRYMLHDSGSRILLGRQQKLEEIEIPEGTETIDLQIHDSKGLSAEAVENINTPEDLIYLIYTSGSTGNPKGVCVKHRNVVRLVKNTNFISFVDTDRILQTGSMAFDASTFEVWGALLNGLRLHVESKDIIINAESLGKYLKNNGITIIWLTSPLFNQMCEESTAIFENLRYLLVGGDVVSPKYVSMVLEKVPGLTVVNGYGPTENTTFSVCYTMKGSWDEDRMIPIGRPIANSTAYIVDRHGRLVPPGVPGELWVGGDGVARGYLNSPELTGEKFLSNPFIEGDRLYRTGDLARWLPADGNIEFLGRIDHQVKIRGFRVELGEIEREILKYQKVKEAIVIDGKDQKGVKYLCAYLTGENDLDANNMREFMQNTLPRYMIPSYIMKLDKMPLNKNGKIERRELPEPSGNMGAAAEYAAPRNAAEEAMARIWGDILGVERPGIDDDFFELGGDSLKLIRVITLLDKEGIRISVSDIFKYKTIRELCEKRLSKAEGYKATDINALENALKQTLGFEVLYKKLDTEAGPIYVIFAADTGWEARAAILSFIEKNAHKAVFPHYIAALSRCNDAFDKKMSRQELEDLLELKADQNGRIFGSLEKTIAQQTEQFGRAITGSAVNKVYGLSAIQQATMAANITLSGTTLKLDTILDKGRLEKSVLKLVKEQGILRSIIVETAEGLKLQEYKAPDALSIPCADISGYDSELRQRVIKEIVSRYYTQNDSTGSQLTDRVLYSMILLKLNEREYELYLPFNHVIFDGMSGELIKHNLMLLYENNGEYPEGSSPALDYQDYIEQINKGPQGIAEEAIIEAFGLEAYNHCTEELCRQLEGMNKEFVPFGGELVLDDAVKGAFMERPMEVCLALFSELLQINLGINKIPVKILHYGRKYMDKDYFNTLGEFLDAIPALAAARESGVKLSGDITEKIKITARHNINFGNLIYNGDLSRKYSLINEKLGGADYLRTYIPLFNFIGRIDEGSHQAIKTVLESHSSEKERKIYREFMGAFCFSEDKLYFGSFCEKGKEAELTARLRSALEVLLK